MSRNKLFHLLICVMLVFGSLAPLGSARASEPLVPAQIELIGISESVELESATCNKSNQSLKPGAEENQPQYVDCTSEAYGFNQGADFFADTLSIMGIPYSQFAVEAFLIWKPYENTYACWNPLATTQTTRYMPPEAGCSATNFNSVGVKNYSSKYCGELATAQTLNLSYYTAIRAMLRQEAFNWDAIKAAVKTWVGSESYATSITNKWLNLWNNRPAPDTTPPQTTLLIPNYGIGENGWYNSRIYLNFSTYDNSSGVAYTEVSINSSAWTKVSDLTTALVNGTYVVNYRSVDRSGNVESAKSHTFYVDAVPPINPSFIYNNCNIESGVTQGYCNDLFITWSDWNSNDVSGIQFYQTYWGKDPNGTGYETSTERYIDPPAVPNGNYYFRLVTKDWAGNYSSWSTLFVLYYDVTIMLPYSTFLPFTMMGY